MINLVNLHSALNVPTPVDGVGVGGHNVTVPRGVNSCVPFYYTFMEHVRCVNINHNLSTYTNTYFHHLHVCPRKDL